MNTASQLDELRPGDWFDDHEVAAIFDIKVHTLRNWRSLGKGPRFRKIGQRTVRYHRADLLAFIEGEAAA
jgi:hypothetical protein